jgi:hypothetical protein
MVPVTWMCIGWGRAAGVEGKLGNCLDKLIAALLLKDFDTYDRSPCES